MMVVVTLRLMSITLAALCCKMISIVLDSDLLPIYRHREELASRSGRIQQHQLAQ